MITAPQFEQSAIFGPAATVRPPTRPFEASEAIDKLAGALAAAQAEFPAIEKSKTARVETKGGGAYAYTYADLSQVLRVTRPILARNGLAVVQPATVTAKGLLTVKTIVLHVSGQWLCETLTVPVVDTDPQKLGSAMSYARRYAYCGAVGVQPEDEDDDGEEAGRQARQQARRGARQPQPRAAVESAAGDECITTTDADGKPGGQKGRLLAILREHKVDAKAFGAHLKQHYGVNGWNEIRRRDYDQIVQLAQAWPGEAAAAREPGEEG